MNHLTKKLFILGSKDPEMSKIESILIQMNLEYTYATKDGELCHPTNAYTADNIINHNDVVFIECNIPSYTGCFFLIDHHNKGDYGYNLDYKDFLAASSVGQLLSFLLFEDFSLTIKSLNLKRTKDAMSFGFSILNGSWVHSINDFDTIIVPHSIVLIAAIDHCLLDAYKGRCFGVDKKELSGYRQESLAENLNLSINQVSSQFKKFKKIIKSFDILNLDILDLTNIDLGEGYTEDYLLLREASIFLNKPIAIKTKNKEIEKLMLLSLSEEQTSNFLKNKMFKNFSLSNVFGVPSRGYAGGIIQE